MNWPEKDPALRLQHIMNIRKTIETMRVIREITGLANASPGPVRPAYTPDPTAMKGVATRKRKQEEGLIRSREVHHRILTEPT
jgi:hypothetical protein